MHTLLVLFLLLHSCCLQAPIIYRHIPIQNNGEDKNMTLCQTNSDHSKIFRIIDLMVFSECDAVLFDEEIEDVAEEINNHTTFMRRYAIDSHDRVWFCTYAIHYTHASTNSASDAHYLYATHETVNTWLQPWKCECSATGKSIRLSLFPQFSSLSCYAMLKLQLLSNFGAIAGMQGQTEYWRHPLFSVIDRMKTKSTVTETTLFEQMQKHLKNIPTINKFDARLSFADHA